MFSFPRAVPANAKELTNVKKFAAKTIKCLPWQEYSTACSLIKNGLPPLSPVSCCFSDNHYALASMTTLNTCSGQSPEHKNMFKLHCKIILLMPICNHHLIRKRRKSQDITSAVVRAVTQILMCKVV